MKYVLLITFILLAFACQAPLQNKEEQTISEVEKQIAKDLIQGAFDDLWAGVDSTKISQYHTDDFVILEHGQVWENAQVKEYMRKQLANLDRPKRINKMDYLSIEKYGESMQISYFNHAEFFRADTLSGKAKWLESALAVQTPEGWKLKMMHSTWVGNE